MVTYPTGFSTLSISNMALSHIGQSSIASLNENSAAGVACKAWYDFSRLQMLKAYDWAFARKRADLVESDEDDDPPPEGVWGYRYILPTDCLAVRYVVNPAGPTADKVPFTMEQGASGVKALLTNIEDATIVYTTDVTAIGLFSPEFIDALSAYLAFRIAYTITGDLNVRSQMAGLAITTFRASTGQDANENVDDPPRDGEGVRARV